MSTITPEKLDYFRSYLINEEKSQATITKYTHDAECFVRWLDGREPERNEVLKYKAALETDYAATSVNSILSSLNCFFSCLGLNDLHVRTLKLQRRIFSDSDRELTQTEYERLLTEARRRGNERLYLLMQTICSTGLRVSEVRFVTLEAVEKQYADINNKGKRRRVYLPDRLCRALKTYARRQKIMSGSVFITKNGRPLSRTNIWFEMKRLCRGAGVSEKKVFPHNLRHLFARVYYSRRMDIVRLADILGHSSINTTRIYTMESGEVHKGQIQELGLLRC